MDGYTKINLLGEGTYAVVHKALQKSTGKIVALKKFRFFNMEYGIPLDAIREIKSMCEIHGDYVLSLLDCFMHKDKLVLVLDFMENGSLEQILHDRSIKLSCCDIKAYMNMILKALATVHNHSFVHRDVKPNNLLLSSSGSIKLADFGLARIVGSPSFNYSPSAFADCYRPPEMLFGARKYTSAVDIWAAGCVFAEFFLRKPIFQTDNSPLREIPQMKKIFTVLGTPNTGFATLPKYVAFQPTGDLLPLADHLAILGANAVPADAVDLLANMLSLDPAERPFAEEALKHKFFYLGNTMTPIEQLPKPGHIQHRKTIFTGAILSERGNQHNKERKLKVYRTRRRLHVSSEVF